MLAIFSGVEKTAIEAACVGRGGCTQATIEAQEQKVVL